MSSRNRILFALILICIAALGVEYGFTSKSKEPDLGISQGKKAVEFKVKGIDQTQFVLSEHQGEPIIVMFMTPTCPSCFYQVGELKKLREEMDVTIASINVDLRIIPSETWVNEVGIDWFFGHSPELGRTYQIFGVPTVIVIDGKGIIIYRGGPTSLDRLKSLLPL